MEKLLSPVFSWCNGQNLMVTSVSYLFFLSQCVNVICSVTG